jgi:Primase C terminal 2 (PriCT-2)
MALHAGGYPFEMWDTWSGTAPDRYQPVSTAVNWRGFMEGGVSIGTLVHLARERGWAPEWMRGREEGRADSAGRPMPVKYQETGLYHQLSSNLD